MPASKLLYIDSLLVAKWKCPIVMVNFSCPPLLWGALTDAVLGRESGALGLPVFLAETSLKFPSGVGTLESSGFTWMGLERSHPRGRSQPENLLTGFFLRGRQILQSWK